MISSGKIARKLENYNMLVHRSAHSFFLEISENNLAEDKEAERAMEWITYCSVALTHPMYQTLPSSKSKVVSRLFPISKVELLAH